MKRTEAHRTIESIQRYGEDLPQTVLAFDLPRFDHIGREPGRVSTGRMWEGHSGVPDGQGAYARDGNQENIPTPYGRGLVSKALRMLRAR